MHRFRLCRPRHSTVVAYLALFAALGGTGYAAFRLPKNSVGAKQIRAGAVRSSKVKDRSLLKRDFKPGQLPTGARGPKVGQSVDVDVIDPGAHALHLEE